MSPIRIVDVDPRTDARWNAFVDSSPDALVYHRAEWLSVLQRTYGYKRASLAAEDEQGRLVAVLPLVYRRGLARGRAFASLPHTPAVGPLARDDDAAGALTRAACERVRRDGGVPLQLRTSDGNLDRFVDDLQATPWVLGYVRRLPPPSEELRFGNSRNHTAIRRAVKKAEKNGVSVRSADDLADVRRWYSMYVATMRHHGTPPHSFRFFRSIWEEMCPRGLARLLLAEQGTGDTKRLLAGSLFFSGGRSVVFAFNGRRADALHLRPNEAVHWEMIHWAWRSGYAEYDFGEADYEGLAAFKIKWGASPLQLYRYNYPLQRAAVTSMLRTATGPAALAQKVVQHLPLPLVRLLGGSVHRYL